MTEIVTGFTVSSTFGTDRRSEVNDRSSLTLPRCAEPTCEVAICSCDGQDLNHERTAGNLNEKASLTYVYGKVMS